MSTSSDGDRARSSARMSAGGDIASNEAGSDEDSQLSYSTIGSPSLNTRSPADSNPVSTQPSPQKQGPSGKVNCIASRYSSIILMN